MNHPFPKYLIPSITLILAIIITAIILIYPKLTQNNETNNLDNTTIVSEVIDGDTFKLNSGETIRLLCIDAPEMGDAGSQESKNFLENLVLGKKIRMEGNETDKYNRSLRWVYVDYGDGSLFINGILVDEGYGDIWVYDNEDCGKLG